MADSARVRVTVEIEVIVPDNPRLTITAEGRAKAEVLWRLNHSQDVAFGYGTSIIKSEVTKSEVIG